MPPHGTTHSPYYYYCALRCRLAPQPRGAHKSGLRADWNHRENLAKCFEMWWPGTELNRRRQPFQTINGPNHPFNQQLNSSRWPIYCDHSVTSADVRQASATGIENSGVAILHGLNWKSELPPVRERRIHNSKGLTRGGRPP